MSADITEAAVSHEQPLGPVELSKFVEFCMSGLSSLHERRDSILDKVDTCTPSKKSLRSN